MFIFARGFAVISNMICIFLLNKADFSAFIGRYWIHAEVIKELESLRSCFSFTILFLNYFMQLLYIFKYENLYKS